MTKIETIIDDIIEDMGERPFARTWEGEERNMRKILKKHPTSLQEPTIDIEKIVKDIVHYIDDVSWEQKNCGLEQFIQTQDRLRQILKKHIQEPTERVVEISKKSGRYETIKPVRYTCNNCKGDMALLVNTKTNFCPGCGAKIKRID